MFVMALFTLRMWKLFQSRGKLLSRILVQFPHELIITTTMFVVIKNLDDRKKKVLFQQYWTNKSFTTHYCLYFKARDSRN